MTTSRNTTPKTITIPYVFLYGVLCLLVFALGAFVTVYGFVGDYYSLRVCPVLRIFPIMGGITIAVGSLNMWLYWPEVSKRYTRPKRYTQLRR